MRLSLIVAMERSGVIGNDGDLPWHLSADLKRFKRLTTGHAIIMGRKTFESIGRLLPERISIIITRQPNYRFDGATIVHSLDDAVDASRHDDEAFVIGGAEIYRQALPRVDRIYLTEVAADVTGDAKFPPLNLDGWHVIEQSEHAADNRNDHPHTFTVLDRK